MIQHYAIAQRLQVEFDQQSVAKLQVLAFFEFGELEALRGHSLREFPVR